MEHRIIIYAPTGKDARLIAQVLARIEVESYVCAQPREVVVELMKGAGALVLVNEAMNVSLLRALTQFLEDQAAWSDLPILVMTQRHGAEPKIQHAYPQLGNVALLERPLQSVTLISAATSALRARQRQYALREIDRRKDEFIAMLAHELRNPLAPVNSASDLLKLPNLDRATIRQTSEVISRQVKHMTGLIDDLLDVSRVSRGLVTLDTAVLDAKEIVTCAVEQVRPLIDEHRHRLTLRTSPEPAYIKGDQKRLIQMLTNVLNNASKYTPDGGEITLSMDVNEVDLKFTVSDNGIGIAPHVLVNVFEMFAQAERTSDRTQGGLGIGLALVKNLVRMHGGKVSAHSDGLGKGSQFEITLRRCFQAHEIEPLMDEVEKPSAELSILVVDDNEDAAAMLGLFLELAGHKVQVAHTAGAAIEIASESPQLDACLLDIGLPDMDGNDLARKLREIPATTAALMIAITGYGQEIDRRRTREAGFDHHHVKPVDMSSLIGVLSTLH